ncbi:GEVED domain-containing protein [Epilithonimonas xixisoli]|uniref:Putative secreted protein (Por secretion system target) n=1 Tax=Epilithonimonas xixisoli TaxID=1476462 RepID=A0A4R8IJX5_9FLAO|nr:GEVED domain-containing protein [Epilithonimonas xixisoli]TDX86919.1 putative secreted protein (Por secretion system target) [Epilithonimonas xixisoli]
MKKVLFSIFALAGLVASNTLHAQYVVYQDSFESYTDFAIANVGGWTLRDVDLSTTYGFEGIDFENEYDPMAFIVFNSTTTTPPMTSSATSNWSARTGVKAMISFASIMPADEGTGPNNDWLISPKIQLAADGGSLSFWAKSCSADYGAEKFRVYISTTGTAASDFTPLSAIVTTPSDATWHEYTYSLGAYQSQNVHIAIQTTSSDQFGFAVDDFKVTTSIAPTAAPNCSVLVSPAMGATDVPISSTTLSWAQAADAESYDVYMDTNADPTTLVGNVTGTSYTSSTSLELNTTYYWKIIPKNNIGAATGCTVGSFKTIVTPAYCGPLTFTGLFGDNIEPITSVDFAGINNTTSATVNGSPAHEFFLDKVGNVDQGSTHTITLKGNTGGDYPNSFAVFIDWNQDGDFADANESYSAGTITNSTGTDAKQLQYSITVPVGATVGNTRMRIKKQYGSATTLLDPCAGASYGQAEDYTLNVGVLAVVETAKNNIKAYPNPVKDIFTIEAQGKIKSVKVYDATGKQLFTKDLNEAKSQIDFSRFNSGVYVVTTLLENGTSTSTKVVKK